MKSSTAPELTRSQQRVLEDLEHLFRLHQSQVAEVAGVKVRVKPLIIGPSGCGKTFLATELARRHGRPVFSVNIANWIVRGHRGAKVTLEQIAEFVRSKGSGVIILDEVNKLKTFHTEVSQWTASVFSEVIAFLDVDERLESMGFEGLREKLEDRFFVVGAAAFQDAWQEAADHRDPIGFVEAADTGADLIDRFRDLVSKDELVPQELLFRFNADLCIIEPPSRQELAKRIGAIRHALDLEPLDDRSLHQTAEAVVRGGKMFRQLESYVGACLREVPQSRLQRIAQGSPFPLDEPEGKEPDWDVCPDGHGPN